MKLISPLTRILFLSIVLFTALSARAQTFEELAAIVGSNQASSDDAQFGQAVAIDGDWAVVGAYLDDLDPDSINITSDAGSAHILHKDGAGQWTEVQKIFASDRAASDYLGYSVAISGDYLVIGAYQESHDENGNNELSSAGSAYIFKRDGNIWTEEQKIVASDRSTNSQFGISLSISGDLLVVGSNDSFDEGGGNEMGYAGAAYIFENDGGSWTQRQKIVASDRAPSDAFGYSVDISGDYVVIGAYRQSLNENGLNDISDAGAAYIFKTDGSTWTQHQKIVPSDRALSDNFGHKVAISGDYVVIGAYQEDHDENGLNEFSSAGAAYVFKNDGSNWNQQQKIVASDRGSSRNFGYSVAISGDYIAIGARYEQWDENGANKRINAGATYIFKNDGSLWVQHQKITPSDRAIYDRFGSAVAISGYSTIIGAPRKNTSLGQAYVFGLACVNTSSNITKTACGSYTSPSGNILETSGIYLDTIQNGSWCDSIITIDLTILNATTSSITEVACDSFISPSNKIWRESGIYLDSVPNGAGCDSLISINLTVNYSAWVNRTVTRCNQMVSETGKIYTSTGQYVDTLETTQGCPAYITTELTIESPTLSSTENINLMDGDTLHIGGVEVTTTGSYPETYYNKWGCDSTVTYEVTFRPIICTDTNFFSVTDTLIIDLLVTGVSGKEELIITAYPNPTQDELYIATSDLSLASGFSFEIYNTNSTLVASGNLDQSLKAVDMMNINPAGIYFLHIIDDLGGTVTIRKIIVE